MESRIVVANTRYHLNRMELRTEKLFYGLLRGITKKFSERNGISTSRDIKADEAWNITNFDIKLYSERRKFSELWLFTVELEWDDFDQQLGIRLQNFQRWWRDRFFQFLQRFETGAFQLRATIQVRQNQRVDDVVFGETIRQSSRAGVLQDFQIVLLGHRQKIFRRFFEILRQFSAVDKPEKLLERFDVGIFN